MAEKIDPNAIPRSVEAPRMSILQKEMEKMDVERKAREAEESRVADLTRDFRSSHVSVDEFAMARRLVANADAAGQGEGSSSSDTKTLAGPRGYRLKAMVINLPGGVPGDIGLFLNWAPPAT
ncbi:MAG: hypothetical protein ABTQ27_09570 [Amaricoccus sp.]|uniref:hypothetical protein n=1 Tax=Amaricoccus sp. TaxID=1872485 RepID=UPI0033160DB5